MHYTLTLYFQIYYIVIYYCQLHIYNGSYGEVHAAILDQNGHATYIKNACFIDGNVLGVTLNLDNKNITFYKNNILIKTESISYISNPYPAISPYETGGKQ